MVKVRYEIDPHNRLAVVGFNKFRTVVDGEFELGGKNSLIYHVKKSDNIDIPQQIKFRGSWSLDKDHNLIFTFDKWNNQVQGNRLILKSDLVSATENELVFSVETKEGASNRTCSYLLKFSGIWQADKYNRLTFNIEKEEGQSNALTLQGVWSVNKQNEIVYSYVRTLKGKKEKIENGIILRGYWEISEKNRVAYVLNENIGSQFDFKVSFQKAEKNFLKYSIGVGYASKQKTTTLFGTWKLDKDLGLIFEIEYSDDRIQEMVFGADCKWDGGYALELRLKNKLNKDLGVSVNLSKKLFDGQGEAFVKALASEKEVSIVGGVGFKW
jgi:hypothetical protein